MKSKRDRGAVSERMDRQTCPTLQTGRIFDRRAPLGGPSRFNRGDFVMKMFKYAALSLVTTVALGITAAPAQAQATRTWVSGVGNDGDPCSRTAPCKTFAGALSKTAAGGEINCLDPGGFGAVSINKSLVISCPYTEGGALAGGNGITVNDSLSGTPNTAVVVIRGLDIFGVSPPSNGIRFIAGAALHVEDTVIRRFNAANSFGISFQPQGAASLYLRNVTVTQNGNGATGGGILIQPTGASGNARVQMDNVAVLNNANQAIRLDTTGNTSASGVLVNIGNSQLAGSANGLVVNTPVGTSFAIANVNGSTFTNLFGNVLSVNGAASSIKIGDSTINASGTVTAIAGGGSIRSYGDNRIQDNGAVPVFTLPNLTGS
jgi:hypothetical protein